MSRENNDLSISIQNDALGIGMVMDDQMRRIALYEGVINDIRKALGDNGLHAQLLDLPKLVARLNAGPRAQACADHGCQTLPEHQHAARMAENASK